MEMLSIETITTLPLFIQYLHRNTKLNPDKIIDILA